MLLLRSTTYCPRSSSLSSILYLPSSPHAPPLPPDHPYAGGLRLAEAELATGRRALDEGNEGMARVCCRRAVGTFIQAIAEHLPVPYGTHAMANLRGIAGDRSLPPEIRDAADRLLGGSTHPPDPIGDAARIIGYFVGRR